MTVQNTIVKNVYVGNGSTTVFPFTFECNKAEHIQAFVKDAAGNITSTTNFKVDLEQKNLTYPNTGEPLANGDKLIILRQLPLQQLLNLLNQGPFYAEDIEETFDEVVMMLQQMTEHIGRSLAVSVDIDSENSFNTIIPLEAGKTFRVKDDGTGFEVTEDPGKVIDGAKALLKLTTEQAEFAKEQADASSQSAVNAQNAATSVQKYKALWFDSVASMKAEPSLTAGAYVCTAGYYEQNDGGGASYLIRAKLESDTDDGGSLHQLNNGLVAELIIENGTVNVKQFGAKGDSAANDTVAFQQSIATGNPVFIPKGSYRINDTLNNPTNFQGVDVNKTIITMTDASKPIIKYTTEKSGTILRNFALQYTGSAHTESTAICLYFDDGFVMGQSIFDNIWCRNCYSGIDSKASIYSCSFTNIRLSNFKNCGMRIAGPGSTGNIFSNIYLENWSDFQNGIRGEADFGIYLQNHSEGVLQQVNIEHGVYSKGIVLVYCENIKLDSIHFEGFYHRVAYGAAIAVEGPRTNVNISTIDFTFSGTSSNPNKNTTNSETAFIFVVNNEASLECDSLVMRETNFDYATRAKAYVYTNGTAKYVSIKRIVHLSNSEQLLSSDGFTDKVRIPSLKRVGDLVWYENMGKRKVRKYIGTLPPSGSLFSGEFLVGDEFIPSEPIEDNTVKWIVKSKGVYNAENEDVTVFVGHYLNSMYLTKYMPWKVGDRIKVGETIFTLTSNVYSSSAVEGYSYAVNISKQVASYTSSDVKYAEPVLIAIKGEALS